jgi:hypothetical protein
MIPRHRYQPLLRPALGVIHAAGALARQGLTVRAARLWPLAVVVIDAPPPSLLATLTDLRPAGPGLAIASNGVPVRWTVARARTLTRSHA